MKVQDQKVTFNVFKAIKLPTDKEECFKVERVDSVVNSELEQLPKSDTLERSLLGESVIKDIEGAEQLQVLNAPPWKRKLNIPFNSLGLAKLKDSEERFQRSIEDALTFELNPLPDHLSYTFLVLFSETLMSRMIGHLILHPKRVILPLTRDIKDTFISILRYWKENLERPNTVMFMRYKEMTDEPHVQLRRLAHFTGKPFSQEEENSGLLDQIIKLCSFDSMSKLEVNKTGNFIGKLRNDAFFRSGVVGDWKNYLTEEMASKLDRITEEKFP
ncbi:hypothetical protein AgCh_032726 [Apium graveolens]